MSIVKATSHSSKSAGRTIDYALNKDKTTDKDGIQYVEGFGGCSPATAKEEFALNKQHWNKEQGRQCLHYINSFPAHEVTPEQALEETRELIKQTPAFKGYQGVMGCHINGDNIHVHIVADSVSVENGYKFQMSANSYKKFKELNQELCQERGYSIVPMEKQADNIRADSINKYKVMEKGDSVIERCMYAVENAKRSARSQEEFISKMKEQGWSTKWKDSRKNITFISDTETKKNGEPLSFRDTNLSKTFQEDVGKESLTYAFEKNRLLSNTIEQSRKQLRELDTRSEQEDRGADTRSYDYAIRKLEIEESDRKIAELERNENEQAINSRPEESTIRSSRIDKSQQSTRNEHKQVKQRTYDRER